MNTTSVSLASHRAEQRKVQIIALLANPDAALSHREIAKVLNCSSKTVQRIATNVKPQLLDVAVKLDQFLGAAAPLG